MVEMTPAAAASARDAWARYGKGVGSPAALNYGDCLAYGVAMTLGQPLLFTGSARSIYEERKSPTVFRAFRRAIKFRFSSAS